MKRQSTTVAVCAVLVALTFVLGWVPYGGVFLLPTLFAACCFGFGISFFSSTMFGVVSLVFCYMMPAGSFTVGEYFRAYPWLPIVARMFIGPIACALYRLLTKIFKPQKAINKIMPIAVTGAVGSALNTLFVGFFIIVLKTPELSGLEDITVGFLAIAGAIEVVVNALLLPPIVLAVKKAAPKLFAEINAKKMTKDELTTNNQK